MDWGTRFLNKVGFGRKISSPVPGAEHEPGIQQAIDNNHAVTLLYHGANDPDPIRRTIVPTQIGDGSNGTRFIRAFAPERGEYRTFRTDRIRKIFSTGPHTINMPADPEPLVDNSAPYVAPTATPKAKPTYIVENPKELYKNKEKSGTIEPTDAEYDEIRGLDIDPDTHDKATVRRIRNMAGITHLNIKHACEQGIPLEDYEQALKNNMGDTQYDHVKAIDEALGYQQHDAHIMYENKESRLNNPSRNNNETINHELSPETITEATAELFLHHLSLKNRTLFDDTYVPIPNRQRANEWIMSEIAKLNPTFKKQMNNTFQDDGALMNNEGYYHRVRKLQDHHRLAMINAGTRKDFLINKRKLKALEHIGNSKFYPTDYHPDIYEED